MSPVPATATAYVATTLDGLRQDLDALWFFWAEVSDHWTGAAAQGFQGRAIEARHSAGLLIGDASRPGSIAELASALGIRT